MTATDADLASQITQTIDAALAKDGTQDPGDLLSLTNEYLGRVNSTCARAAAAELLVLATSSTGSDAASQERFRTALINLRSAINQAESPKPVNQFAEDPELVQEFLVECRDHLATVESNILRLEREPGDEEALHTIFRSFHTIKGLAGFLGAVAIQELAHETENVLDLGRSGKLIISPAIADLILRSADELLRCLAAGESGDLNAIGRCNPALLESLESIVKSGGIEAPAAAPRPQVEEIGKSEPAPAAASGESSSKSENSVLKVDSAKLEYLIDMVGELVIAESVIRHDPSVERLQEPVLSRNLAQLLRVVQEVQKTSMSMRMVTVGTLFRKMNRLVRDVSRKSGKVVELVTVGDETELDRTIVEDLADPLVHMIRNAVDHGIETPEDREKAGKPRQGIVRLEAKHDAGDIVIEMSDDGRGLNREKILAKAIRQGLIRENDKLDEQQLFGLIFEPGFSTSEKVTDLSGRGVGMDVVRRKIQKLRGSVTIASIAGKGSTFTIRLPLTLAIIDGLVVGVGAQRYILPMFAVREMFSPGPNTFVTLENRAEAALFRDHLLPVVRLSRLFDVESSAGQQVLIVVEGRNQLCCIAVDQLIGKQEVVIKNLGKTYRDIPAISGGAILGDGRVGLIIDVNSLHRKQRTAV